MCSHAERRAVGIGYAISDSCDEPSQRDILDDGPSRTSRQPTSLATPNQHKDNASAGSPDTPPVSRREANDGQSWRYRVIEIARISFQMRGEAPPLKTRQATLDHYASI